MFLLAVALGKPPASRNVSSLAVRFIARVHTLVSIGIYFYELSMEKKFLASTKTILYQWKHLNFLASKPIMEADLTIHLNLVGDYPLAADLVYLYTAAAMGGQSNLLGFYYFSRSVECLL